MYKHIEIIINVNGERFSRIVTGSMNPEMEDIRELHDEILKKIDGCLIHSFFECPAVEK